MFFRCECELRDGTREENHDRCAEKPQNDGDSTQYQHCLGNDDPIPIAHSSGDLTHTTAVNSKTGHCLAKIDDRGVDTEETKAGWSEHNGHGLSADHADDDIEYL